MGNSSKFSKKPTLGPQVSLVSLGPVGATYLQRGEQDATSDGDADLIVVVDLFLAIRSKAMHLLENENQNGGSVQVLFNPIGSGQGGDSGEYLLNVFAFFYYISLMIKMKTC